MPRPSPTTRRKQNTVTRAFLFSDLRDYTSFVEANGDAAAARLLREYRTLVRREVSRHEGAEVKTEGDSFYVVFERASDALDCAIAILRAADTRSAKDPKAPLRIGVGLHAGETIEYDDQFVGSAVNVASRLAGKAAAMELVISDTLRGLVRTGQRYAMKDIGALELKGVAEPIRAWSVEWREQDAVAPVDAPAPLPQPVAPPASRAGGQLLCPIVIGRAAELARFTAALDNAAGGAGGDVVVLGGEAGVGKTRFVREAQQRATERNMRVLLGATHQSDATLPYAPFVSAIRSGFRGLARDELGRVLQRSAPDLAELFPELARGGERASAPSTVERHRLSVAFQHLFRSFAREAPLLVVLEDVHWSDETSLELLSSLAAELRDARVVMLATYRTDEMHRRHPFLRTLADLQRQRLATEVRLERLSAEETRELIRATMATRDPNVRVSDEFRDALFERAEGNPFFTEELLKALVESGGIYLGENGWARKPIAELAIPGSVREAVRARVERLPEEARTTVAAASVIGLRFPFALLAAVRGIDEATLETHLRQLVDEQLVAEAARDLEEYAFRHALTREVVYDDLMVRERKRLHRAVADTLAREPRTEPALLAHHLLAAGEREAAVPVLVRAGDRALQTSAPREAVVHYAAAIEIGLPDAELAPVLERQAEAYHFFDQALTISSAREAERVYAMLGDAHGRSRALRLVGRAEFYHSRQDIAIEHTRQAIAVVAGKDSVELARATAQLAGLYMAESDMPAAAPLAEEAVALAERVGDAWALANALITRGSIQMGGAGEPDLRRGIDVARREGIPEAAQRGYNNLQIQLISVGTPWQERRRMLEEALAYGVAHGLERATTHFLLNNRMYLEQGIGEWEAALATASELETFGSSVMIGNALYVRALIVAARDGARGALDVYERLGALPEGSLYDRLLHTVHLARGRAMAGNIEGARETLKRLDQMQGDERQGATVRTPRSAALGGPGSQSAIVAAVLTGDRRLLDEVSSHLGPERIAGSVLARTNVEVVAAARAVLEGDAAEAARRLAAIQAVWERVGFFAIWTEMAAALRGALVARGVALTPEWQPIVAELRAFAERTRATARLAELAS